ncbi:MAG: HAMP domain-containing protein [Salinivirgaceae bacterium]|nr:HAMP domain-containing protein [Salinivirgaceae bacterium]
MLLVVMLAIAGIISAVEFRWISNSVNGLIRNNYESIKASKSMLEALEREDSGILLLLLGEWKEGRTILHSADSAFMANLIIAQNNITETNEKQYLQSIQVKYSAYKQKWKRPIVDTEKEGNISWYRNDIHQLFIDCKMAVDNIMTLNQSSLYNEASELHEKSRRAIMPGIISIIAAVIFSLILNFFITRYFVRPISELADAINNYKEENWTIQSNIKSNDEIKELENAIKSLLQKIARKYNAK